MRRPAGDSILSAILKASDLSHSDLVAKERFNFENQPKGGSRVVTVGIVRSGGAAVGWFAGAGGASAGAGVEERDNISLEPLKYLGKYRLVRKEVPIHVSAYEIVAGVHRFPSPSKETTMVPQILPKISKPRPILKNLDIHHCSK